MDFTGLAIVLDACVEETVPLCFARPKVLLQVAKKTLRHRLAGCTLEIVDMSREDTFQLRAPILEPFLDRLARLLSRRSSFGGYSVLYGCRRVLRGWSFLTQHIKLRLGL